MPKYVHLSEIKHQLIFLLYYRYLTGFLRRTAFTFRNNKNSNLYKAGLFTEHL